MSEADLKKHKVEDICAFVKNGNISMVANLIQYYNVGRGVLSLRTSGDTFDLTPSEKIS